MNTNGKVSDFLINNLDIDFNEITVDFIRDLPLQIQKLAFFKNNNKIDHLSEYFSVGQAINYNGEDVEVLAIDNNYVTIFQNSTNTNIEVPATEILRQNGYLKDGEKYDFDTDIDFTSEQFKEIQNDIIKTIDNSLLDIDELKIDYKENGKEYIINNIENNILKKIKEEYYNMV